MVIDENGQVASYSCACLDSELNVETPMIFVKLTGGSGFVRENIDEVFTQLTDVRDAGQQQRNTLMWFLPFCWTCTTFPQRLCLSRRQRSVLAIQSRSSCLRSCSCLNLDLLDKFVEQAEKENRLTCMKRCLRSVCIAETMKQLWWTCRMTYYCKKM